MLVWSSSRPDMHLTVYYVNVLAYKAKLFMVYFLGLPLGGKIVCYALKMAESALLVRFNHHTFPINLMTYSLTKLPHKQTSHIFVLFVSQKFVAN
jgi:hypothetical protein